MTDPLHRDLSEATLEELRDLTGPEGPLAARWCARCDRHYRFCDCGTPSWKLRADGKLGPLPREPGGPMTLADFLNHARRG